MERGSRLSGIFQSLEKLNNVRSSKVTQEDLQQMRFLTAKILQYCTTQEKSYKDQIIKSSAFLDQILLTLEVAGDSCVRINLINVLLELLGKTNTGKKASVLVSRGATQTLFHLLVAESKDPASSEELLIGIHQVLLKLGPKDRKFGVKARLSQSLPVTLNLIRSHLTNAKALQPLMHVLKLFSNNAVNASHLGKNGAVHQLFKVLTIYQRKQFTLIKYTLEALGLLVKSKSNSARAIGQGGVPTLLNMFSDWHRFDTKNRHIAIRKGILNVLKHITNLKSGRKALTEAEGIRTLYNTCQESDSRDLESLIFLASLIMRKCFPRNRLPLSSLRSAFQFTLPESDFHVLDTGEGQDSTENLPVPTFRLGDEDSDSSVDHDDDISSDDDTETQKLESDEDIDGEGNGKDAPTRRTSAELYYYKTFFPELYEFDNANEDDAADGEQIIIPTGGGYEPSCYRQRSATRMGRMKSTSSNASLPHYPSSGYESDLSKQIKSLTTSSSRYVSSTEQSHSRAQSRLGDNGDLETESGRMSASAVNMKTGVSVFSLGDIQPSSNNTHYNSLTGSTRQMPSIYGKQAALHPLSASRSPKNRRRSVKSSNKLVSGGKDKRAGPKGSRSGPKTEDWLIDDCNVLNITSLASNASYEKHWDAVECNSDEEGAQTGDNEAEEESNTHMSPEIFAEIASKTKSAGRFNKIAFPELHGHSPPPFKEALYEKTVGTLRTKIFEDIDRFIADEKFPEQVVYDLDSMVATAGPTYAGEYSNLSNTDEARVSKRDFSRHLKFNAQFESGNLRKAVQVREYEYDLILNPDVNTNHHHQWFYFEVSNMVADKPYRFNIVNCEKLNSQFNFGMKPLLFSVMEALNGRPHWVRDGTEICYYKNHFTRSSLTTGGVKGKSYYTATFSMTFKHSNDVCYMAYHYPYTYSTLQSDIYRWEQMHDRETIYFKNQVLTETLAGNPVPVLTITSFPPSDDKDGLEQMKSRPYIFLSSRVHPGESNSSWVMRGTINFLLSDKPQAQNLRDMYIFKVVPMLNPDGVINGNHRCSLVAEDLNRRWLHPCPKLHPTIFHTKGLLQFLYLINKAPFVYCDYHGHSRRKNVFLYGCSPNMSWMQEDMDNPALKAEDNGFKTLPKVLQNIAPSFALSNCSFVVEKSKESTARVVVWRQIGVARSYTMESSYCGCDQGPYKSLHLSTREHEEMGRKFCEGLIKIRSRHSRASIQISALALQKMSASDFMADSKEDDSLIGATAAGHASGTSRDILLTNSANSSSSVDSDSSDNQDFEEDENGDEGAM